MKKFLISEEEKKRILGMHKDATKRHYLGEQSNTGVTEPSSTETAKPTFTGGDGVAYYVPNLDGNSWSTFVGTAGGNLMDFITFMQSIGVKTNGDNPFKYPKETYDQQYQNWLGKVQKGMLPDNAFKEVPILGNINYYQNLLTNVNETYLKNWRPSVKGIAVMSSDGFKNDPNVKNAKQQIANFDEIYPKIINKQSQISGLKVA
jgi:hypothetical protein